MCNYVMFDDVNLLDIVYNSASPKTSIPQLFAVMRQWVPQTQRNMKMLTREVRMCLGTPSLGAHADNVVGIEKGSTCQ